LVLLGNCSGFLAPSASALNVDDARLPTAAERKVDFVRDIQPLFAGRCHQCHGSKKQESSLRLDIKTDALKGGEHGPAIVPGKSADSLIVQLLAGTHPDLARMPKKGDKLTSEQIGLVRAWIDQGASWPESATADAKDARQHWAFKAPVRPVVPEAKNLKRVRNPIDNFVLARLEKEGLKLSPEADRITLLRRLSLDLIGLPPTIEQVDGFLADKSPNAYEKQVERLLNSPHYGERWGRQWLDAARYADSDGFEKDKPRFIWFYRDWVINALNRDLPYDEFIIEQIAGDLLPRDPRSQNQDPIVATGFLRNSMLNEEGGVDPEQFRMEAMFDRMDAIGKSILGLTIQCAQCHNHKFDPIKQEEYYRMFAFLNNDNEAAMIAYSTEQQMLVSNLSRQMRDLEAGLRHTTSDWQERMNQWEDSVKNDQPDWVVVECRNSGENGERFYYYADGSIRAASYAPTTWTAHFRGTNDLPFIGAFRLEQLPDPNLPCGGPGRSIKGMSALSEFKVEAVDLQDSTNKIEVKFGKATADFANADRLLESEFQSENRKRNGGDKRVYGPVEYAIDGKGDTAWGIDAGAGRRNVARKAVFLPEKPIAFTHGAVLNFQLQQNHGGDNSDDNQNHNLGRWRISVTSATNVAADPIPSNVRDIFKITRDQRTPAQIAAVFNYWRTTVPEFKEIDEKFEALWKQWPEGSPTLTLVARQGKAPGDEKRATQMLRRGDWLKPADVVTAGVPEFLHPLPTDADGSRLTFARWLVDRRSPTAARSIVNRIWQSYFGIGIVETSEDLGMQAPAPSHPELLDWLAVELMEPSRAATFQAAASPNREGATISSKAAFGDDADAARMAALGPLPWSLKHIHRLIVTSSTYRQSSKVTPELYTKDQYNRLLARGPRFRVEAEGVRDISLAASGLLNPKLGGPSVYPPAPDFLFQPPASYGPKIWNEETGPDRYRRAIYTFRYRSVPYPVLQTFDAPNGDFSCVRRGRSNTPLQALVSLNEPIFMEAAKALALHTLEHGGRSDADRITYAFRLCVSRAPKKEETNELLSLLNKQQLHVSEGWVNANDLGAVDPRKPPQLPKGATPAQLAAWTTVSRVLLNLDETITKD
jgi:mono/diheme cytochrome c family protein